MKNTKDIARIVHKHMILTHWNYLAYRQTIDFLMSRLAREMILDGRY